jgi:tRNA 2-selenouridine synthase
MSGMIKHVGIVNFMEMAGEFPVLDVRSPAEFEQGHIPGAINMPLFDDDERARVGTAYKKSGREKALLVGLEYAGKKLPSYVTGAKGVSSGKKVLMHCWRGGMRSESMSWLLCLAGFDVYLLEGGYKSYRRYIRQLWEKMNRIIVLSGKTGTGKTEILRQMQQMGQQVLDFEYHARHKGSAFGALGESAQPTSEQFENDLAERWVELDPSLVTWTEDESRNIGCVSIPEKLNETIHSCTVVCLDMPEELRIGRLVVDYASFPESLLLQSIEKIRLKLGGQNAKLASEAVQRGDFGQAAGIILKYYDKAYNFDLAKREPEKVFMLRTDTADARKNAEKILEFCKSKSLV